MQAGRELVSILAEMQSGLFCARLHIWAAPP